MKNFCEDLFFFFFGDRLKNFCEELFFFWRALALVSLILGLESVCPRKGCPWPWPRIFFVSLTLASILVSSTPPLVPTFCSFNGLWFDYIDSADYDYKYAPMQSIFHCDYFTFNHRYYDYIASPNFNNNFCHSTYEIGIYPAFLLQSTQQFCFE